MTEHGDRDALIEDLRAQLAERERQIEALEALTAEMRLCLSYWVPDDDPCAPFGCPDEGHFEQCTRHRLVLGSPAGVDATHRLEQRIEAARREAREWYIRQCEQSLERCYSDDDDVCAIDEIQALAARIRGEKP